MFHSRFHCCLRVLKRRPGRAFLDVLLRWHSCAFWFVNQVQDHFAQINAKCFFKKKDVRLDEVYAVCITLGGDDVRESDLDGLVLVLEGSASGLGCWCYVNHGECEM